MAGLMIGLLLAYLVIRFLVEACLQRTCSGGTSMPSDEQMARICHQAGIRQ